MLKCFNNNLCMLHMNKSESLIKLNKCLNDITSLSSSASSCDLNDNKQTRSKWSKTSRGCSNRKWLILLCFISFFFNPLFGKFEIIILFDKINYAYCLIFGRYRFASVGHIYKQQHASTKIDRKKLFNANIEC